LAHRLLEGGVDVILGHHPHVLMPVEVFLTKDGRTTLVAYSLGNFIANQSRFYVHRSHPAKMGNTRDGVVLKFSVVKRDYGQQQQKIEIEDLSIQPLWTDNNALQRQQDNRLSVCIRVVVNETEIEKARQQLEVSTDPKERIQLKKRIELLKDRMSISSGILGEDLLSSTKEPTSDP
jgi:poly-gamma-glutamate synthesis protein (capsule biosynthesis protein)